MKSPSLFTYLPWLLVGLGLLSACDAKSEPRIYNAPKEDTIFVVKPPVTQPPRMAGMPAMSGGANIAASEKRIFGAIFPLNGSGCFLKITDTIARIDKIQAPMEVIVRDFKLTQDGKPEFPLPEGWTMGEGDAFALAKVSIPVPGDTSPATMTISVLNAPDLSNPETALNDWNQYVLMQMNRWNGQVSHESQDLESMLASLKPVQRDGDAVPAYIFDKNGSKTDSATPSTQPKVDASSAESTNAAPTAADSKADAAPVQTDNPSEEGKPTPATESPATESPASESMKEGADATPSQKQDESVTGPVPSEAEESKTASASPTSPETDATLPPSAGPLPSDAKMPNDANHAGLHSGSSDGQSSFDPTSVKYDTPEGWVAQPPRTFRLATFKIAGIEGEKDGEVVVSLALDNPIENSKMWAEQLLKTDDPAILVEKAESIVGSAEDIDGAKAKGKIYKIQGEPNPSANVIHVAVLPMTNLETSMFIKLSSSQRMAEEQQENLRRFVKSLRWE